MIIFFILIKLSLSASSNDEQRELIHKGYEEFEKQGNWILSSEENGLMTEEPGLSLRLKFNGSHVRVFGKVFNEGSAIDIFIDGIKHTITKAPNIETTSNCVLFSKELQSSEHLIEIISSKGKILVSGVGICNDIQGEKHINHKEAPVLHGIYDQRYKIMFYNMNTFGEWTASSIPTTTKQGASKAFYFNGTQFFIYGYGQMTISINGGEAITVDSQGSTNAEALIYESEILPYQEYTVNITRVSGTIAISHCEYIGHAPHFVFTQANYLESSKFNNWRTDWQIIGSNNNNAYIKFSAVCQRIFIYGRRDPTNGLARITLDGKDYIENTTAEPIGIKLLIFDSGELEYQKHFVEIHPYTSYTQINGILYYVNTDNVFTLETAKTQLYSGSVLSLRVGRPTEQSTNASLTLKTESNMDETYFTPINQNLFFDDGEIEKFVRLETKFVNSETINYSIRCLIEKNSADTSIDLEFFKVDITVMCFKIPTTLNTIAYSEFTKSADWIDDQNGGTVATGGTANSTFTGTFLVIYGKIGPNFGQMNVYIDDLITTINTHDYDNAETILYVFPYLLYGDHTLTIKCADKQIGLNYITYYNDPQYGTLSFDKSEYEFHKGSTFLLKINRFDGITGRISCDINIKNNNVPGSMTILIDDLSNGGGGVYPKRKVTFEEGVLYQEVRIYSSDFPSDVSQHYSFEIELINVDGGASISSIKNTTTVILIDDVYPSDLIHEVTFGEMNNKNGWNSEPLNFGGWTSSVGNYKEMEFIGNRAYIYGYVAFNHGDIDIYIDETFVTTINTTGKKRVVPILLYVSPMLEYGSHKIKAQQKKGDVGLCNFKYYDSQENGIFCFGKKEYVIEKNGTAYVEIVRTKGTNGDITVVVQEIAGGNATSSQYITIKRKEVVLPAGISKETFNVFGKIPIETNSGNSYTVKIEIVGFKDRVGLLGNCTETEIIITDPIYPINNLVQVNYNELTRVGGWTGVASNYGGWTSGKGNYAECKFKGVKAFFYGYISHGGHGECDITLDDEDMGRLQTSSVDRVISTLIYVTPDLDYGEHTLRVTVAGTGAVGVNFINYLTGFFPTQNFSASDQLSFSNEFQETLDFPRSVDFIKTNDFSYSGQFKQTDGFSISSHMTMTEFYSISKEFGTSFGFSRSALFYESKLFSISSLPMKSDIFSSTNSFKYSDEFSSSATRIKRDDNYESSLDNEQESSNIEPINDFSSIENPQSSENEDHIISQSSFNKDNFYTSTLDAAPPYTSIYNEESSLNPLSQQFSSIADQYSSEMISSSQKDDETTAISSDVVDHGTPAHSSLDIEGLISIDRSNMYYDSSQNYLLNTSTLDAAPPYTSIYNEESSLNPPSQQFSSIADQYSSDIISSSQKDDETTAVSSDGVDHGTPAHSSLDIEGLTSIDRSNTNYDSSQNYSLTRELTSIKRDSERGDTSVYLDNEISSTAEHSSENYNSFYSHESMTHYGSKYFSSDIDEQTSLERSELTLITSYESSTDTIDEDEQTSHERDESQTNSQDKNEQTSKIDKSITLNLKISDSTENTKYIQSSSVLMTTEVIESSQKQKSDIISSANDRDDRTQIELSMGRTTSDQLSANYGKIASSQYNIEYETEILKHSSDFIEDNSGGKGLNSGQIAGIVIGVIVVVIVIILVIYFLVYKKEPTEQISESESFEEFPTEETISGLITNDITKTNPDLEEELGQDLPEDDFPSSNDYDEMPNELIGNP